MTQQATPPDTVKAINPPMDHEARRRANVKAWLQDERVRATLRRNRIEADAHKARRQAAADGEVRSG